MDIVTLGAAIKYVQSYTGDNFVSLDSDGLIPVGLIPPVVIQRMYTAENDTARFNLTIEDVQNGDTVYVADTQTMYMVIDDFKLDTEAGYKPYSAGVAVRAIGDENGNKIDETYQKIADTPVLTQAEYDTLTDKTARFYAIIED